MGRFRPTIHDMATKDNMTRVTITVDCYVDLNACSLDEIREGIYIETTGRNFQGVLLGSESAWDDDRETFPDTATAAGFVAENGVKVEEA